MSDESFPGSIGAEVGGGTIDRRREFVQAVNRDDYHPFVQHVDARTITNLYRFEVHAVELSRNLADVRITEESERGVPVLRLDPSNARSRLSWKRDQLFHDGFTGPHGDEQPLHWDQHAAQN